MCLCGTLGLMVGLLGSLLCSQSIRTCWGLEADSPEITLKNQQLIVLFPSLFGTFCPAVPLPLPSTLAWHLGPFVVLIETETFLGPAVCFFNSTVEEFLFFFFFFVCFSFPFSFPKPGGQCTCRAKAVCWASLDPNKTLINGRWDFLVTAFSQRAKVAH